MNGYWNTKNLSRTNHYLRGSWCRDGRTYGRRVWIGRYTVDCDYKSGQIGANARQIGLNWLERLIQPIDSYDAVLLDGNDVV